MLCCCAAVLLAGGFPGAGWALTDCRSVLGAASDYDIRSRAIPLGGCSAHSSAGNNLFRPEECFSLSAANNVSLERWQVCVSWPECLAGTIMEYHRAFVASFCPLMSSRGAGCWKCCLMHNSVLMCWLYVGCAGQLLRDSRLSPA
jgi:hypothetical protein